MLISIGDWCQTAIWIKNIQNHATYPFDWVKTDLLKNIECVKIASQRRLTDNEVDSWIAHTGFPHDDPATVRTKYIRRFQRLHETMNAMSVHFWCVAHHGNNKHIPIDVLKDLAISLPNHRFTFALGYDIQSTTPNLRILYDPSIANPTMTVEDIYKLGEKFSHRD